VFLTYITVNCSEVMIERLIRMEDVDGLPK